VCRSQKSFDSEDVLLKRVEEIVSNYNSISIEQLSTELRVKQEKLTGCLRKLSAEGILKIEAEILHYNK